MMTAVISFDCLLVLLLCNLNIVPPAISHEITQNQKPPELDGASPDPHAPHRLRTTSGRRGLLRRCASPNPAASALLFRPAQSISSRNSCCWSCRVRRSRTHAGSHRACNCHSRHLPVVGKPEAPRPKVGENGDRVYGPLLGGEGRVMRVAALHVPAAACRDSSLWLLLIADLGLHRDSPAG